MFSLFNHPILTVHIMGDVVSVDHRRHFTAYTGKALLPLVRACPAYSREWFMRIAGASSTPLVPSQRVLDVKRV